MLRDFLYEVEVLMSITSIPFRFMFLQACRFSATVGLMLLAPRVRKNIRQLAVISMILVVIDAIFSHTLLKRLN